MATSTLALGQANYALLESLGATGSLDTQNVTQTVQAKVRGGVIADLGIGFGSAGTIGNQAVSESNSFGKYKFGSGLNDTLGNIAALNIADVSRNIVFNDADLPQSPGGTPVVDTVSNANINFLKSTSGDTLGLGGGNNRVNASSDFLTSEIQALDGLDTVRIGGRADGSLISLGDGNDQLTVGLSTRDLDVDMGGGNDTAIFQGALSADPLSDDRQFNDITSSFNDIKDGSNIINMGSGNDAATFVGGVRSGYVQQSLNSDPPSASGYEINLGDGADTAIFGSASTSEGFTLNTGRGGDSVILGRQTGVITDGFTPITETIIDLGYDTGAPAVPTFDADGNYIDVPKTGDTVVLGVGARLDNTTIRSGQSSDVLDFRGSVTDATLDLGWGNSLVNIGDGAVIGFGSNQDTTVWDLGAGADTLRFSEFSELTDLGDGAGLISLGTGADLLDLQGTGNLFSDLVAIPGVSSELGGIQFDLGADTDTDQVNFGITTDSYGARTLGYNNVTIFNFGETDILFIGAGQYGYGYVFANEFASLDDLKLFKDAGNSIWGWTESDGQQLMTLDTVQFEPPQVGATPTDAYNYVEQLADSAYVDTIKAELDQVSDWIPASEPIDTSIISPGFYESNNNQSSGLG